MKESATTSTGKRLDRKAELVQIAGQLFAERGFLATTIRDVADAAGIQSGSLYHHFTSKESMVEELLQDYWDKLLVRYLAVVARGIDTSEEARELIRESVLLIDECRYAVRMMLSDWDYLSRAFPFMEESLRQCQEIWLQVLRRGQESGSFRADQDPYITYRTIMGSISGTSRWFDPRGPVDVVTLADQISALFMEGISERR